MFVRLLRVCHLMFLFRILRGVLSGRRLWRRRTRSWSVSWRVVMICCGWWSWMLRCLLTRFVCLNLWMWISRVGMCVGTAVTALYLAFWTRACGSGICRRTQSAATSCRVGLWQGRAAYFFVVAFLGVACASAMCGGSRRISFLCLMLSVQASKRRCMETCSVGISQNFRLPRSCLKSVM
jgi:hypothetical protein